MKRITVDTNVLLSFLTDRDAKQQERASSLFEAAATGEMELILHQVVLIEMVYVLRNLYGVDASRSSGVLEDLLALPGVVPVDGMVWGQVLELWPAEISDFADAIVAMVMVLGAYDAVATFDQRFVKQLKRRGFATYWSLEELRSLSGQRGSQSDA